jgi:hypothetical protein
MRNRGEKGPSPTTGTNRWLMINHLHIVKEWVREADGGFISQPSSKLLRHDSDHSQSSIMHFKD